MSPAGGAGKTTTVTFVRAGVEVARVEVPGHVLEFNLPASIVLDRLTSGTVRLVESADPRLECCGTVEIPWVSSSGFGTEPLIIPPPTPFDEADITTMWQARNRLLAARRPPTSGSVDWSSLEQVVGAEVDWSAVEQAVSTAARLLGRWPERRVPAERWLSPERSGGRILVSVTERARRVHRMPPGPGGTPAVIARRTTVSHDHTLHALTAVAALLAERISSLPGIDAEPALRDKLVGTFRQVAARSHSPSAAADPPPSVWPPGFAASYSTCLRALASTRATGPGQENAPLSEVWELFEAWCAETLLTDVSAILGPSLPIDPASTCIGRWVDGSGAVELHSQARFPVAGTTKVLGREFVAVIGELIPDLCLFRREGAAIRALVLDAKKRSALMAVNDLGAHGAKYLWGIRAADAVTTVPAIEEAFMLAPLGGAVSGRVQGRARVSTAHPASGLEAGLVDDVLALLR